MGLAENIDALLVKHDITQESLARIAEVSPSSVTRWRHGGAIRKKPLEKICAFFSLTEDDLLSDAHGLAAKEHGYYDPRKADGHPVRIVVTPGVPVPVVGRVHAGNFEPEEVAERVVHVTEEAVKGHPNAKGLIVDGHCMDRVIPEGCCVLYDPDMTEPANGSVVIVETEDYSALMRRWYSTGRTLVLSPDSFDADIEDIVLRWEDGPIRVLGTVFHFQAPDDWEEWIRLQDLTS